MYSDQSASIPDLVFRGNSHGKPQGIPSPPRADREAQGQDLMMTTENQFSDESIERKARSMCEVQGIDPDTEVMALAWFALTPSEAFFSVRGSNAGVMMPAWKAHRWFAAMAIAYERSHVEASWGI